MSIGSRDFNALALFCSQMYGDQSKLCRQVFTGSLCQDMEDPRLCEHETVVFYTLLGVRA